MTLGDVGGKHVSAASLVAPDGCYPLPYNDAVILYDPMPSLPAFAGFASFALASLHYI